MMILRVDLEMFRQVIDALAQECDLYFGRPGVTVVCLVVADDSRLAVFRKSHDRVPPRTAQEPFDSRRSLRAPSRRTVLRAAHVLLSLRNQRPYILNQDDL